MIPDLEALPSPAKEEASRVFHAFSARKGGYLCYPEDEAHTLYFIEQGWVRIFQLGPDDEEYTLAVSGPGEIFGVGALVPGERYNIFAGPLVDCQLLSAGREDLLKLFQRFPEIQRVFTVRLSRELRLAEERLRDLRFKEVLPRLAKTLLLAAVEGEEGPEVVLSHQDLAHLTGSTRETVTKVLGDLSMQDVVELDYRRILLLEPDKLRQHSY